MKCMLKRLLPFFLTLIVGLTIGSIHNERRDRAAREFAYRQLVSSLPLKSGDTLVAFSGGGCRSYITRPREYGEWTDGERRLLMRASISGLGSGHNKVINIAIAESPLEVEIQRDKHIRYSQHEANDVTFLNVPQPKYWQEKGADSSCSLVLLNMTLSSSGEVTDITPFRFYTGCSQQIVDDGIEAARQIRFKPAMKNGQAISRHATILYNYGIGN